MNTSQIKAVVFDCDGVMFDTASANRRYYNEVLDCFDKPPMNDEQFINVHMMTVKEAIAYLFPEMDDLSLVNERIKHIGYHKFIRHMVMEDGLIQLLKKLGENAFVRGIATNRTNTMEKVLTDFELDSYFEIIVTAATVASPKPAPDQLDLIMATFKLEPQQILFIGDSDYDRQAAQNAGTLFAAFKNPGLTADINVTSMDEIAGLLKIKE